MKQKKILWYTGLVLALLLFPAIAKADIHVLKMKHTDAFSMMGQTEPAKDEEGGMWIAKDKFRHDEGEKMTWIVRYDLKKIYVVNHENKSYSETPIPIDFDALLDDQAKQMMGMFQASATVTDTGETQKIKNWNCKKYILEINMGMMGMQMPMKLTIWTSKDVGIDLKLYQKLYGEVMAANPMFKDILDEFKKLEGFPIRTEMSMSMMGAEMKYNEEVVSIEKKSVPAGTYDIPEGYTKAAYNPFMQR